MTEVPVATKYSQLKTKFLPLIKFCIVGVSNTAVDVGTFSVLVYIFSVPAVAAHVIGFSVGGLNSYVLNSIYTFRGASRRTPGEMLKFGLMLLVTLVVSTCVLEFALRFTSPIGAKALATLSSLAFGYILSATLVFKKSEVVG
jgi:putative flippase GtrA